MISQPEYASDFEALVKVCEERGVAIQTIKSLARRRWKQTYERRFSWYEPLQGEEVVGRAVRWVLKRPGFFLNTSSDATLLPAVLEAAKGAVPRPSDGAMQEATQRLEIEPLFIPGISEGI